MSSDEPRGIWDVLTVNKVCALRQNIKDMKKSVLLIILTGFVGLLSCVGFTSCVGDDIWWSDPGSGWDSYNDPRLRGCWELVQANSYPVPANKVNYLYFNGNGTGWYLYYDQGYRESERLRYWCQDSYGGRNLINIQYEYDSPLTTEYWFSGGKNETLWMQWTDSRGRVQTYVYDWIGNNTPW